MSIPKKIFFLLLIVGCSPIPNLPSDDGSISVYFCATDNCRSIFVETVSLAKKSIDCALFDIDDPSIIKSLYSQSKKMPVRIVVDDENKGELAGARFDTSSQFSHNKFCVIDSSIVITGSMNPTMNGIDKNDNNLLVIKSPTLSQNFKDEFMELWAGDFGEGTRVSRPVLYIDEIEVKNYFCPEDECASRIITEIRDAARSIYFMTFSFTSEPIADALLFTENVDIRGVFEKRGSGSSYSQYERLKAFGFDVRVDNNSYSMHHKVFIIDNRTVITGSMNPTASGDSKNDENVLIIHDKQIALKYVDEFRRVYGTI